MKTVDLLKDVDWKAICLKARRLHRRRPHCCCPTPLSPPSDIEHRQKLELRMKYTYNGMREALREEGAISDGTLLSSGSNMYSQLGKVIQDLGMLPVNTKFPSYFNGIKTWPFFGHEPNCKVGRRKRYHGHCASEMEPEYSARE
ncbi:unnamed protein product [Camellia sinensis]